MASKYCSGKVEDDDNDNDDNDNDNNDDDDEDDNGDDDNNDEDDDRGEEEGQRQDGHRRQLESWRLSEEERVLYSKFVRQVEGRLDVITRELCQER